MKNKINEQLILVIASIAIVIIVVILFFLLQNNKMIGNQLYIINPSEDMSSSNIDKCSDFSSVLLWQNKCDNYKGTKVLWRGVISDRSQVDGIKFWLINKDRMPSSWNYFDWFWAMPEIMPSINEYNGQWVQYMMKKYGNIAEGDIDPNGIYEISGTFDGSDCDYYEMINERQNIVCIPQIIVSGIKLVGSLPVFTKYTIKPNFSGKSAVLDFKGNPKALEYKTVLSETYSVGPNFAGHYTVATWGCGSTCIDFAIMDNNTGAIFFPFFSTRLGLDYSTSSNLLITNPPSVLEGYRFTAERDQRSLVAWEQFSSQYYKWEGNRLILVYPIDKDIPSN